MVERTTGCDVEGGKVVVYNGVAVGGRRAGFLVERRGACLFSAQARKNKLPKSPQQAKLQRRWWKIVRSRISVYLSKGLKLLTIGIEGHCSCPAKRQVPRLTPEPDTSQIQPYLEPCSLLDSRVHRMPLVDTKITLNDVFSLEIIL
jgi:hypothetical protein